MFIASPFGSKLLIYQHVNIFGLKINAENFIFNGDRMKPVLPMWKLSKIGGFFAVRAFCKK